MTRDIQRQLPHNVEAEQGVLGSMMILRGAIAEAVGRINEEYFYIPAHRTVFMALVDCWKRKQPTDLITFSNTLQERNELKQVGGRSFVTSLFTFVPTAANIEYYLDIVVEHYQRRQLIAGCTESVRRAYEPDAKVPDIKRNLWDTLRKTETRRNENQAGSTIVELQEMIDVRQVQPHLGIRTGIDPWDKALGGILSKRFYVIGARPKVGKSSLLEQAIQNQNANGIATLVFQRDMSLVDMVGRMACRTAGVVYQDFMTNTCKQDELEMIRAAAGEINTDLLRLYSPTNLTAEELASIVEREIQDHGVKVFYLDLFQRLKTTEKDRIEGLTNAANMIRDVIQTTGVPGVILAEILKEADKTKRPHSGQFKYCDGLFSTCDVSIMLWSNDDPKQLVNAEGATLRRQKMIFTIDANRAGGVGDEELFFDRPHMTFHAEDDDDF